MKRLNSPLGSETAGADEPLGETMKNLLALQIGLGLPIVPPLSPTARKVQSMGSTSV